MKNLNKYIIEKLHLNKDTDTTEESFEDYMKEIEDAIKYVGITSDSSNDIFLDAHDLNGIDSKHKSYAIIFKSKENKAKIKVSFIFDQKDKDSDIECFGEVYYTNGKYSPSVMSNVNRTLIELIELDKKVNSVHTIIGNRKQNYYLLTNKVFNNIISCIKDLKYYKEDFINGLSKSRFTQQQFDKLANIIKDYFI